MKQQLQPSDISFSGQKKEKKLAKNEKNSLHQTKLDINLN